MYTKRTDLALDAAQSFEDTNLPFKREDYQNFGVDITKIIIDNEDSVKALGKPFGKYITVHLSRNWQNSRDEALNAAKAIKDEILELIPPDGTVLVVGLGNINITADNIGPKCSHRMIVTRHLKEQMPENFVDFHSVASLAPGVLGLTGIETGEIVKGTCDKIKPSAIIAVDALATADTERLCRTIQITDSGITPGSGVGNFRFALNQETFGIPVIAIGVPTVVESSVLIEEVLLKNGIDASYENDDNPMVVTPKDIDILSDKAASVIATALNLALHEKIDAEELMEFMA